MLPPAETQPPSRPPRAYPSSLFETHNHGVGEGNRPPDPSGLAPATGANGACAGAPAPSAYVSPAPAAVDPPRPSSGMTSVSQLSSSSTSSLFTAASASTSLSSKVSQGKIPRPHSADDRFPHYEARDGLGLPRDSLSSIATDDTSASSLHSYDLVLDPQFEHDSDRVYRVVPRNDGAEFLDPRPEPPGTNLSVDHSDNHFIVIRVTLPGFTLDNITVAMRRNHKVHIVADSYGESGGHFDKLVALGSTVSSSAPRALFDGNVLTVHVKRRHALTELSRSVDDVSHSSDPRGSVSSFLSAPAQFDSRRDSAFDKREPSRLDAVSKAVSDAISATRNSLACNSGASASLSAPASAVSAPFIIADGYSPTNTDCALPSHPFSTNHGVVLPPAPRSLPDEPTPTEHAHSFFTASTLSSSPASYDDESSELSYIREEDGRPQRTSLSPQLSLLSLPKSATKDKFTLRPSFRRAHTSGPFFRKAASEQSSASSVSASTSPVSSGFSISPDTSASGALTPPLAGDAEQAPGTGRKYHHNFLKKKPSEASLFFHKAKVFHRDDHDDSQLDTPRGEKTEMSFHKEDA